MEAHRIPEGAIVTKPTGSKEYILCKDLRFYNKRNKDKNYGITAEKGTIMLVHDNNINIIPESDILGWVTTFSEVYEHIENIME